MQATKLLGTARRAAHAPRGAFLPEFALVAIIFLLLLFGVMEVARAMYLINTLQEVTRHAASAAARVDYRNRPELNKVKKRAVFNSASGKLLLGSPVTDQHVRIDYLALVRNGDNSLDMREIPENLLPSCTGKNRHVCMADPNDPTCIRFVRARICRPGTGNACVPVKYEAMLSLVPLSFRLPESTTIATAESLGYERGDTPCM